MIKRNLNKELELVLIHFHNRICCNKPLVEGANEAHLSEMLPLGKSSLYRDIKLQLEKGKSLSDALMSVKGVPNRVVQIIRRGETQGDMEKAIAAVLKDMSVFKKFNHHFYKVFLYMVITLGGFWLFLFFLTRFIFPVFLQIAETSRVKLPFVLNIYVALIHDRFLIGALLAVIVAYLYILYFMKDNPVRFALRNIPYINKIYFKIISLEMASVYAYSLNILNQTDIALKDAVQGLSDNKMHERFARCLEKIKNGTAVSTALYSDRELLKLPVTPVLAMNSESKIAKPLIDEFYNYINDYLDMNLDDDMKRIMIICIALCGLIVGAGIILAFKMILFSQYLMLA